MRYSQRGQARRLAANRHLRLSHGPGTSTDSFAQLAETLLRSRDLLRAIFDQVHDGLALVGRDRTVLAANLALARLYGTTPAALVGSVLATDHPLGVLMLRALAERRPVNERRQITTSDGQARTLDIQLIPQLDLNQSVEQVVLHVVDTTEQAQAAALVLQNEQLASSRRLAGSVAHRLNTPLQAAQNYLYLLDEHVAPDERGKTLRLVTTELDRMAQLVRSMLEFQQTDGPHQTPISVGDLVERALLVTGGYLQRLRVTITCDMGPDLPVLFAHGDELLIALVNLILHAVETMADEGMLRVAATVHVGDDGKPAALRLEVGQVGARHAPGASGRAATNYGDGRIELSRRIVEQCGGALAFEARHDGARSAVIVLPLVVPLPVPAI